MTDDRATSRLVAAVEPLIPGLRRYAIALVRDRSAADDLVQDCLERVVGQWKRGRDEAEVPAWVYAILRNLALNHLRQVRSRGPQVPVEDADPALLPTIAPGDGHLAQRDILRALDLLPEEQKSVLLLVSVEDRSYAEAALILDVPIGTVMSRLSRGRERLRRLMEEREGPASGALAGSSAGSIRRIK